MTPTSQKNNKTWKRGAIAGATAFALVYLPNALAVDKFKVCKENEVKMCRAEGKPTCVNESGVAKKLEKGFTFPTNGACGA